MDSLSIQKIHAINKYRKQQFISNVLVYTLTTMACSLLVFSPFWYPPLRATVNVFLSVSLPKVLSLFLSAKVVFIVGNLIVIFLVGEFKIYTVTCPSQAHGARGQILQSSDKERGNPEVPLEKGQNMNMNMNLHCTELARGTTHIEVDRCKPQNGDPQHLGAQSHQMISVALKPKRTNKVTRRHEKSSVYREACLEQKEDHGEELLSCEKDLNKMADDFIARVNKQRRLEAELYRY
ncbi:hypothetical protein POM88_044057 [Heracleum sosnowskyi]|uniref:DUF4408 domain-containing protein n=1 Tax=Heracleum sosnowskyi TaxID=360622 RepID=A0AAD8M520_9APIA|nr:hypothetical protein POM88_044057 [Heracleum sosnowskyi]